MSEELRILDKATRMVEDVKPEQMQVLINWFKLASHKMSNYDYEEHLVNLLRGLGLTVIGNRRGWSVSVPNQLEKNKELIGE